MAAAGHSSSRRGGKSAEAFRTISEVADDLDVPQHVLRFWETKFTQVRPLKRGGGRRYYRPEDVELLRSIRALLYTDGYTIKGVQKLLREGGVRPREDGGEADPAADPPDGAAAPESPADPAVPPPAASVTSGPQTTGDSAGKSAPQAPSGGLDAAKRQALGEILAELEELKRLLQPK